MPKLMKKILSITLILIVSLLARTSLAQELFDTDFDVTYSITPTGESNIVQNIKITNRQSDVVATNYSLIIKDMNIYDAYG